MQVDLVTPFVVIGRPGAADPFVIGEPGIRRRIGRWRSADGDCTARIHDALENRERCRAVHPMDRAAERHEIEGARRRGKIFDAGLNECDAHSGFGCRLARGIEHAGFWIYAGTGCDKRRETDGEQPGSAARVEQAFFTRERNARGNFFEESAGIRLAVTAVIRNRRSETPHGSVVARLTELETRAGALTMMRFWRGRPHLEMTDL